MALSCVFVNDVVILRATCGSTGINVYVSLGGQDVLDVGVTLRTHSEKLARAPLITSEINIVIKTPHAACRAEGAELRQCSCEDRGGEERMLFVLWRSVRAKTRPPKRKNYITIIVFCTSQNTSLCTSTHLLTNMGKDERSHPLAIVLHVWSETLKPLKYKYYLNKTSFLCHHHHHHQSWGGRGGLRLRQSEGGCGFTVAAVRDNKPAAGFLLRNLMIWFQKANILND